MVLALECDEAGAAENLQRSSSSAPTSRASPPRTGKLREAHDRLAHHYACLTEGFDRGPAREAKAALDELAARLDPGTPAA